MLLCLKKLLSKIKHFVASSRSLNALLNKLPKRWGIKLEESESFVNNKNEIMNLNKEKLESLISNKFIIDCIQIKLTQQKEDDPIVYQGSGSIFQLEDGNFHLKLYHNISDLSKEAMFNQKETIPGKIISKEHYFSMEALDMSGDIWVSHDISVSRGLTLPAAGMVINTKIDTISTKQDRANGISNNSSKLYIVLPGKYHIPCNCLENLPSGGSSLNTCRIDILGINLEIIDRKNYITIRANDPSGNMNDSFKEKLIEALNIVFGKITPVLYKFFSFGETSTLVLSSIPTNILNQRNIPNFIKHGTRDDVPHFKEFVEKYIVSFTTENEMFFGYWHKINRAWQGSIENAALSLCTAIEGITKEYYSNYGLPDDEIVQEADKAKSIIENAEIGQRIKERLLSSIAQIKKPNPRNVLYKLVHENKLKKEFVECWKSLRNKSAHADNLKEGAVESQKYLNEVFTCLNLFNVLLLLKIGFNGTYQDLSNEGWGESHLIQDSETVEDKNI